MPKYNQLPTYSLSPITDAEVGSTLHPTEQLGDMPSHV